jgi:hypothetical protein
MTGAEIGSDVVLRGAILIKILGSRIRPAGRRHAPPVRGRGALAGAGAAVRLHPFGFGLPSAVIVAAIAYLVIAGPVSVRLGHPGPAGSRPQAAVQVPSVSDPTQAARSGSGQAAPGPAGQVRPGGTSAPAGADAQAGSGQNIAAGAGGGSTQPTAAPGSPVTSSSPAPRSGAGPSPAPSPPAGHSSCLDLDVVTVCV